MSARQASVTQLVNLVKRRTSVSFEELCNHFSLSPKKCTELIEKARQEKYAIGVAGEGVAIRPAQPTEDIIEIAVSKAGDPHSFAVASDLHFGSKYHLRGPFTDFIDTAYARGVRNILLGGDLLDGCYRHGRWELTKHGYEEQAEDFADGLPQRRGLSYYGISGNHDETFERESGMVVHRSIESTFRAHGRSDLHMLGARGAYLRLRAPYEKRGVLVELWHPLKGPAYALSYKLQKHVESYAPGQKPDMLFTGHWHQSVYCVVRGVHAFSAGTFQGGGGSFGKALGGAPSIGGWIVQYAMTPEGTLRHCRPEWVSYYENERVREVGLG